MASRSVAPLVPNDETRTIVVSKDTTCGIDPNDGVYKCVNFPGFGFTDDDGNIDFNNVCQCVGPATASSTGDDLPVLQVECDPDPTNPDGCEVDNAEVPVEALFQNPICFTVGGFRRCF